MIQYFVTVHRGEDQNAFVGEDLDSSNKHMIFDSGYDVDTMLDIIRCHPWKVLWVMERSSTAKFGWKFKTLYGIPK